MTSDDREPLREQSRREPGSGPDRARAVGERIAGVPTRRLGEALRASRRRSGVTVSDAALRGDLLQRWLVAVEDGELRAAPEVIADLLAHYGTDLDEVLPPRRPLLALDGAAEEQVLSRYLDAVRRWRGGRLGDTFRTADLQVLGTFLGVPPDQVRRRLERMTRVGPARWRGWLQRAARRRR